MTPVGSVVRTQTTIWGRATQIYRRLRTRTLDIATVRRKRQAGQRDEADIWLSTSREGPLPHFLKQALVRTEAIRYAPPLTFVESGTLRGDMVAAMAPIFAELHSIELNPSYFRDARFRFRGDRRIHIYEGDSAEVLETVLSRICGPTIFWLDGHYSGGDTARGNLDTPVRSELAAIAQWGGDGTVLIDDARCFSGANGYPSHAELTGICETLFPGRSLVRVGDVYVLRIGEMLGTVHSKADRMLHSPLTRASEVKATPQSVVPEDHIDAVTRRPFVSGMKP